ncbi:acetyl-CoA carboxylase carboxyltransferase subunit alpha [Sporosarcina aquimarina]|uniref:Acetyl-coenzyme A carboxylase carboxyl transferase subunit alpha n=1 Tax=Sporosarcina aquimarina TaxID=114975 RepID=A0ABU4G059_9BACL|nr:acetyl-CoA carboxylase carboxyltransferase subunit alpha [Sporosarcina aquimarina]MDW0110361.1 acetyl-CoA carboxylase carboxyltransferase subunit alpha [Sporosarcina aquimarina]
MKKTMSFEEPIIKLREKIQELTEFTETNEVDLSAEIHNLNDRLAKLEDDIYGNMDTWERVQVARHPERPTTYDYIGALFEDFIELHGDRCFGDDAAIVGGIGTFNGKPVTIIGHQRGKDTKENVKRTFGMPHPEGYRKALRLMKQAEKFKRPIICLIDTKGAYPGRAAEERGQSEAIARNLVEMAGLTVPVISIVIGEGGSGGALALGVANRIYMLEHSTYSVISPEGAASILWKDAAYAKEAAEAMKITAPDLLKMEIIDEIIPEVLGGGHRNPKVQAEYMKNVLVKSLDELGKLDENALIQDRYEKFRKIGVFSVK